MRTTVTIDDSLYEKALEIADRSLDKAAICSNTKGGEKF